MASERSAFKDQKYYFAIKDEIEDEFIEMFDHSIEAIYLNSEPSWNGVTEEQPYPKNAVWFKPTSGGKCSIAFSRQTGNANETMSMYRFRRENGTIVDKQEIIFYFPRKNNNGLDNGVAVYFTVEITAEEAAAGYEYVIGKNNSADSSGTSAGFIFLKLAGTDTSGGPSDLAPDGYPYRFLDNIDFVANTEVDLTDENFEMYRSILELSGTQSSSGALYYNAVTENVIYHNESSISINQKIENGEAEPSKTGTDPFPPRIDVKQQ